VHTIGVQKREAGMAGDAIVAEALILIALTLALVCVVAIVATRMRQVAD